MGLENHLEATSLRKVYLEEFCACGFCIRKGILRRFLENSPSFIDMQNYFQLGLRNYRVSVK